MANVKFLRGLQAQLPVSGFQDGAFYLTTDTNRLYVAQGTDKLALLNQTVKVVANRTALDNLTNVAEGDFSYISDINVLAVYKNGSWTQINPDTYLTASTSAVSTSLTSGVAAINVEVKDSANHIASGSAKIKAGTDNVSLTRDADGVLAINVAAPESVEYDLVHTGAANEAKLALQKVIGSTTTQEGEFLVKAGANATVGFAEEEGVNVITVAAADMYNTGVAVAAKANSANGFDIQVTDGKGAVTGSFDPVVEIGKNAGSVQSVHFVGGKADLDVYTTSEIDTLFAEYEKKVDAMTYRGTVVSYNALSSITNPENGDVVKLSADDGVYKAGDLFIYNGTTWEYVPSGNEDTTYKLEAGSNSIGITNNTNTNDKIAMSVNGVDSNPVSVAGTLDNKEAKIVVSHSAIATEQATGDAITQIAKGSQEFDVVTSVEGDGYGHAKKVTTQKVTVVDTHANISTVTHAVSVADNIATISTEVKDTDNIAKNSSFTLASAEKTLEITASGSNVNIELVWGSFGA